MVFDLKFNPKGRIRPGADHDSGMFKLVISTYAEGSMDIEADAKQLSANLSSVLDAPTLAEQSRLLQYLRSLETNAIIRCGMRHLPQSPPWWRKELADRLADLGADPDPVLGEIRAYGTLSTAGFDVMPVPTDPKATPDFRLTARDGTAVIIDVATKEWDAKELQALRDFQNAPCSPAVGGERITFREHSSTPFGAPSVDPVTAQVREGDSVTANVVQRLCGIKQRETQFKAGDVNLLYLDLARGDMLPLMDLDSTFPLRQWNDDITSGELFAAFYGRKGMPIYNNRPLTYGALGMTVMGHEGRFRQNSKLSGVLVSCSSGVTLLENPWAVAPLSCTVRRQLLECFGAKLEYFWACFSGKADIEIRIDQGIALLDHFTNIDSDD